MLLSHECFSDETEFATNRSHRQKLGHTSNSIVKKEEEFEVFKWPCQC